MTRTGKIARLPRPVRDELNQRLSNGEAGQLLVAWLNARDDVRALLATHFGGREITEQNLSEWRNGGFEDWLRHQETRDWIRNLVDKSTDLVEDAEKISVADWLSAPIAVAIGRCIEHIATESPGNLAQQKNLLLLARELTHVRHADHKSVLLELQRERLLARANPTESK